MGDRFRRKSSVGDHQMLKRSSFQRSVAATFLSFLLPSAANLNINVQRVAFAVERKLPDRSPRGNQAASGVAQTDTGFYYPLGKKPYTPSTGGIWLGRDEAHGGHYFCNLYHLGV